MVKVNDLVPSTSGRAHLGVNGGPNRGAFDIASLAPFITIHALSGVFHDPLQGQSGVLRFSSTDDRFEKSVDGGLTFTTLFEQNNTPTLQQLYERGNTIYMTGGVTKHVFFIAQDRKTIFANIANRAPLRVSGLIPMPADGHAVGDLTMLTHNDVARVPIAAADQREVILKARSLGLGTLALNTGSGMADISVGSGIFQIGISAGISVTHLSNSGSTLTNAKTDITFDDLNYIHGNVGVAGPPVVLAKTFHIMSPGLYECSYNVNFNKTGGGSRRIVKCQLFRNFVEQIDGSVSYGYARNTDHGECTCSTSFLFEAESGDFFNLQAGQDGTADSSNTIATIDNSWIIVQRIGSRRHEDRVDGT